MPVQFQPGIEWLKSCQNPDGGWGYFPGKQSWLEPTAYALLALHAQAGENQAFDRGWALMRSWQLPDGGWKACEPLRESHWTTALCITLHCARRVYDAAFRSGMKWLLETSGAERRLAVYVARALRPTLVEFDPSLSGWPWNPGTSSWIEPTAQTLYALKRGRQQYASKELDRRIEMGERMILERRCSDGGWNYGSRRVLRTNLPSYPETTGLALLGLEGNRSPTLAASIETAQRWLRQTPARFARARLALGLACHGLRVNPPRELPPTFDVLLTALEILAFSEEHA